MNLELCEYFEDLVEFVKESQLSNKLESHEPFSPGSERIFRVLRDFGVSWKKSIRSMDSDDDQVFRQDEQVLGLQTRCRDLTKGSHESPLLLYYSRFLEVSETIFPRFEKETS